MSAAITCSDLSFSWPDGAPALDGSASGAWPSTTGWSGCPAGRPSASRWPRCSCAARTYGGNLDAYEEQRAAEQAAAERAVAAAAADVRREQRDLGDAQVKQARRDPMGRQVAASGSLPRIVAHARKRAAQETAGRSRELHSERLDAARGQLDAAGWTRPGRRSGTTPRSGPSSRHRRSGWPHHCAPNGPG